MPYHRVSEGECIYSIAARHGLHWETVWNDPENEALKALRKDPNLLHPSDEVFVRELEVNEPSCATEKRHRFRKKGVLANLRVRILLNGEPRVSEEWKAIVDGCLLTGKTDGKGVLKLRVPPRVPAVEVTLQSGYSITLQVRHLDPIGTVSGVQGRLSNLGYDPGPIDNIRGPLTISAIKRFQADHPPLAVDGIAGPKTCARLKEVYGC